MCQGFCGGWVSAIEGMRGKAWLRERWYRADLGGMDMRPGSTQANVASGAGIAWACSIGSIGGVLPAIRAACLAVAVALAAV
jgi:hypothetical protein